MRDQDLDGVEQPAPLELGGRRARDELAHRHRPAVEHLDHRLVHVGSKLDRAERRVEGEIDLVGGRREREARVEPALARGKRP
jgi:hypothetical protein